MQNELAAVPDYVYRGLAIRDRANYGNDGDHQTYTPDIYVWREDQGMFISAQHERGFDSLAFTYVTRKVHESLVLELHPLRTAAHTQAVFSRDDGTTETFQDALGIMRKLPQVIETVKKDSRLMHFASPLQAFYDGEIRALQHASYKM
jgi:hypothetical protein